MHFRLAPSLYDQLQIFAHAGHKKNFQILAGFLDLQPGDAVLEVGCGTGLLARRFLEFGCQYVGIDAAAERIERARIRNPTGRFLIGDVSKVDFAEFASIKKVFIHALLHHLDDVMCVNLIHRLLLLPDTILAITEPVRPSWPSNPIGWMLANLDEGKYVRTLQEWLKLYDPFINEWKLDNLMPRLPQQLIYARLRSR